MRWYVYQRHNASVSVTRPMMAGNAAHVLVDNTASTKQTAAIPKAAVTNASAPVIRAEAGSSSPLP
jgi:hypothetical protein